MFKKFVNFFFEEEEMEQSVEEELEEIEEVRVDSKEETIFYEVAQKASTFIDLDSSPKESRIIENNNRQPKQEKKSIAAKKPATTEYVFTSVISPIFGSVAQEVKPTKTPAASSNEPYAGTPAPTKDSLLGTIISPIYGKVATTPGQKQVVEQKQEDIPLPPKFELDEMITMSDVVDTSIDDDLHQFSLFEIEQSSHVSEDEVREELGIGDFFDERRK